MSWVCISDDFDVFTISKAIFKDVGGGDGNFETLNKLQVALTEKLLNKRFLLVLDDVWDENADKWELLKRPFTVGALGSKVLVTTRNAKVASVMDSVQAYHLDLLSDGDALSLFAQHASGQQNINVNRTLKLHGEDIVKKCGRLPLALRALGRVFRTKSSDEEWEELLNSEIWKLGNESGILPALKLSYYDLPPRLKQMFVYCCLFPKDYTFDMDELVLLWMAEGFLGESNANKSMESFGRECFKELVSRSFFQHSNKDKSQYTMHDLINDLANSVAGEFFFMLEDKTGVYDRSEALEKFHHISFIQEEYVFYRKFKALQRTRCLRTFLAISSSSLGFLSMSNMALVKILPQLQFLRVLSLANSSIKEVPESIGGLKHLRYLNFSNTCIEFLPEQVGDLLNLQSLLLSGCDYLCILPNSVVELINLRHLDINDTPKLNEMPLGFGRLTGLQTLSKVIIGGTGKFRLSDLKGFLHLHGQLSIQGLHKVKNAAHQKKGICDLQLKWSNVFDGSRNEISEYEVLEGLRPFEKPQDSLLWWNKVSYLGWGSLVCLLNSTYINRL
ncbi:putative P-loop containing nucleoside triphosphate hydrolase, leucine-rich repeat domain superfamily [Helianthus annuus]|nr:putative P-loop containing nucleoside triphosphate hydrolase, leucine-rich repeat domain superfamily [Helianthus annuus]KAJ0662471.1 putative P-loop containing nucleoside triphosphate hydrolase, leucine-rich repeat domain superfamily [Helianthus annuus]KAJ0669998.1 putative P-loop containing nucleoside triphosphate hydrolase, leucine-rich repeat domain superfamily [Helianthus annuus]KAJ0847789.1 putative P-loop containing nucleoside triphosphate hydrolase, leucine-rich repeat domain superfami